MTIFPLTKDVQAFLLRMTATLERIDGAVAEAQLLIRDVRQVIAAVRSALGDHERV
jgi:hypothetical protein